MKIGDYHRSIALEFNAKKNRIRDIVEHWPEDGSYKERLLLTTLRNHLPSNLNVGSGFIVRRKPQKPSLKGTPINEIESSSQVDIIVYRNTSPTLFKDDDFVIVTAEAVIGIIEVKTNLKNQKPRNVIKKMNELGDFVMQGKITHHSIFNGIFSFDGYNNSYLSTLEKRYKEGCNDSEFGTSPLDSAVSHIAFNDSRLLKFWKENRGSQNLTKDKMVSTYELDSLAYSYFIGDIIKYSSDNFPYTISPEIKFYQTETDKIIKNRHSKFPAYKVKSPSYSAKVPKAFKKKS